MGVSHANPVWKFKIDFVKKNWEKAWGNKEAFIKYWGLASKLKPIKSFDSHIFTKHVFNSTDKNASKFIKWADIKNLIKEWYNKSNKKIEKTESFNELTEKMFPTIKMEVDMWRKIWTNAKWWSDFRIMRIIVDYDGNIISWYPVAKYQVK